MNDSVFTKSMQKEILLSEKTHRLKANSNLEKVTKYYTQLEIQKKKHRQAFSGNYLAKLSLSASHFVMTVHLE